MTILALMVLNATPAPTVDGSVADGPAPVISHCTSARPAGTLIRVDERLESTSSLSIRGRLPAIPAPFTSWGQLEEPVAIPWTTASGQRLIRFVIPERACVEGRCPSRPMASQPFAEGLVPPAVCSHGQAWPTGLSLDAPPDNPWFVLQFGACGPPGATCGTGQVPPGQATVSPPIPPGNYAFTTPPYLIPAVPAVPLPNPNYPSPVQGHSNVMRHWTVTQDSPINIVISCPVNNPGGGAPNSTLDIFAGGLGAVGQYTWETWLGDMETTIAKFAGVVTASLFVTTTRVYANTPLPNYNSVAAYGAYDPPLPPVGSGFTALAAPAPVAPFPFVGGQTIWDWSSAPVVEPNGNGPTGNGVNEIIFLQRRQVGNGGFVSMDLDPSTGAIKEADVVFDTVSYVTGFAGSGSVLPSFTTGFLHEIGHFFGLDHTNLHPGLFPLGTSFAGSPSWMGYSNPVVPAELPGMVGRITAFSINTVTGIPALHPDERTGISRIHPVQFPDPITGKTPLINGTATFRGYLLQPGSLPGRFGDNVFVLPRTVAQNPPPATSTTPPDATFPLAGTVSGTARFLPGDIVGQNDTTAGPFKPSSGGFEIIGVPAARPDVGTPFGSHYDLIAEDFGFSGVQGGAAFAEWYQEGFMNPTNNAIASIANQTRFYSNDGVFSGGLPGLSASWLGPGLTPVVGSFSVVPGSIIEVGIVRHVGGAIQPAPDLTSRPLLFINERTRPPSTGFVTLVSASNYPLNLSSVQLTVNNIVFNLAQAISLGTVLPPSITPPTVIVRIPANHANFLPPPGVPARLRLTAQELGPAPAGVTFVTGINEVQY